MLQESRMLQIDISIPADDGPISPTKNDEFMSSHTKGIETLGLHDKNDNTLKFYVF